MLNSINLKNSNLPYFASAKTILDSKVDNDTFPYPRWYKGVYNSPYPIVDNRNAGWTPTFPARTRLETSIMCIDKKEDYEIVFQNACSTIFPRLQKKKVKVICVNTDP